jgi:prepilin peptidase CpaA
VGQTILPIAVVLVAVLTAAVADLRAFRISNLLTLPLLLSGLLYHCTIAGTDGLLSSLLGMLFGFAPLFLFYLMGGMGGGDVKLMAAVGAWLGVPLILYVFVVSALAAGVYGAILIVATGRLREAWVNLQILWHRLAAVGRHLGAEDQIEAEVKRPDRRRRIIPFAAMIAVGIIAVIVWSLLGGMLPAFAGR